MKFLDINDCEFIAIKNEDKNKVIDFLNDNNIEFKKFVSSYQLFCENEVAFLYEECYKEDAGYLTDERFQEISDGLYYASNSFIDTEFLDEEIYNELSGISPFIRIN